MPHFHSAQSHPDRSIGGQFLGRREGISTHPMTGNDLVEVPICHRQRISAHLTTINFRLAWLIGS